jgi:gas vesicle protein
VTERAAIYTGAMVGALVGAAATYLFFTDKGRGMRDRLEPAVDELMGEFQKFRRTLEKVGDMANDGVRAFQEFQQARGQSQYPSGPRTSH